MNTCTDCNQLIDYFGNCGCLGGRAIKSEVPIPETCCAKKDKRIAELEEQHVQDVMYYSGLEKKDADSQEEIERLRGAIKKALWWGEQHTDSAVGRRIYDFKMALKALRAALEGDK